ncbi:MAG: hypothetical protein Q9221_003191 [Calogaya cf. arnoldii]
MQGGTVSGIQTSLHTFRTLRTFQFPITTNMSTFEGFTGGDIDPPPQPDHKESSEDEGLTVEELIMKYSLSREQKAELRRRLKAEWTPKLLGKKCVKTASDDPDVRRTHP